MKILICGWDGLLGSALRDVLQNHQVDGGGSDTLDITNIDQVREKVAAFQPDVVINAAAYTNVDGCTTDFDLAYKINSLGPQNLAIVCAEKDIDLVQVSTNEVFAGEKEDGYNEWDVTGPINGYGKSKTAGEFNVRNIHPKHYIVRTAWLYAPKGRNFVHAILRFAHKNGAIKVVTDEIGNPTYTLDLANAIAQLIETKQYGTYHFVNNGAVSRWEFANEILKLAGLADKVENAQITSDAFQRVSSPPPICGLNNHAGKAIGIELRPWQDALKEYMTAYPFTPEE